LLSAPAGTTRPRAARPRRPRQSTTIFGYPCRPPRFHLRLNEKRAQGADVPDGPDVALRRIGSYSQCSTRSPVSTPNRSASSWQAFGNAAGKGPVNEQTSACGLRPKSKTLNHTLARTFRI
jgi:hypothetical protein